MQESITYKDRGELVKAIMRKKTDNPRGILGLKLTPNFVAYKSFLNGFGEADPSLDLKRFHWLVPCKHHPSMLTEKLGVGSPCPPQNRRLKLVWILPFFLNTCPLRVLTS